MIKIDYDKNGRWYNEKGEYMGETVRVSNGGVYLKTKDGSLRQLCWGWVDENGNFYRICQKPIEYCLAKCSLYRSKTCRFHPEITGEGYYISG